MLDKNRHALVPKQCGRDGKGLLPRLLEIVGSVRMKRQERLGKGDSRSHLLSQILSLAGIAPKGLCPRGCLALWGVPTVCLAFLPQGHTGWDTEVTQCLDVCTCFQAEDLLSMTEMVLDNPIVQLSG